MSVTQQQILLLTFRLLFQIRTCLCRERPTGQAAPARAPPPLPSIWPRPCGPGGAAPIPCCSSGTPAGPPGEKRHGPYCTGRSETPASEQRVWGRGGRTPGWEVRMPSLSTWKPGHTTATGSWGARPSVGSPLLIFGLLSGNTDRNGTHCKAPGITAPSTPSIWPM